MSFSTYGSNEVPDSQISAFNRQENLYHVCKGGKVIEEVWAFSADEAKEKMDKVEGEYELKRYFQGAYRELR